MLDEEAYRDPVHLTKGINLRDLMTSHGEFHIDVDFKNKTQMDASEDFPIDDEDSDSDEDAICNIEEQTSKMMLSSPEYYSFKELATKMIDVLPSGEVKLLIIEEGDGPLVPMDAEVTFHYAAYWEKASIPFDSTLTMNAGDPMRYRLGVGRILPGLEIGLTSVRGPQARFHLLLEPTVTWGPNGIPPRIKPEPALFIIALYDVRDVQAAQRFNDLPQEEQSKFEVTVRTVKSLLTQAKDLFVKKKYKKSIKEYQQAISVLRISNPQTKEEEEEIKQFKIKSTVNLAVCYYKINKPKYIILMCKSLDRIIDIENHCKGLFYFGRAYDLLGKYDDALKYYKKALKLEPRNTEIGNTLAALDEKIKQSAVKEKEMWQSAFNLKKENEVVYDVDEDFKNGVVDMCKDMAGRDEYSKFDLPTGLNKDEVACIKSLAKDFEGLIVQEEGEGRRKKLSIIKLQS